MMNVLKDLPIEYETLVYQIRVENKGESCEEMRFDLVFSYQGLIMLGLGLS